MRASPRPHEPKGHGPSYRPNRLAESAPTQRPGDGRPRPRRLRPNRGGQPALILVGAVRRFRSSPVIAPREEHTWRRCVCNHLHHDRAKTGARLPSSGAPRSLDAVHARDPLEVNEAMIRRGITAPYDHFDRPAAIRAAAPEAIGCVEVCHIRAESPAWMPSRAATRWSVPPSRASADVRAQQQGVPPSRSQADVGERDVTVQLGAADGGGGRGRRGRSEVELRPGPPGSGADRAVGDRRGTAGGGR